MLNAQEIANYLVKNLDAIAATKPNNYQFSILAELGRGYDGKKINGMVRTIEAEIPPIPMKAVEAKYTFVVEMFMSGPSNYTFLNVNAIINEFIKANQSKTVAFENGNGLVTFTMGVPKSYKVSYELGSGVPLVFTVNVTYTENAVTSGDKHWLLDGVEIPFLSESVTVEREGIPRKIYTEVYSKILLTGQTKFYTFRIPYESATFKALQAEILQSPAVNAAEHTLTYYDGAAFTQENPFTTKVTIFRSGSSSSSRPNGSAYEVTFTDVYNSENQPLKYELALIDFPFDQNGDDTRYFESVADQTKWFEGYAKASSAPFITIQAPNLEGVVITKQVYRLPAPTAISQFDLAAKNYAIIRVTSAADGSKLYFYYFIENSVIGADGCIMLDLKMDTIQTYFFKPEITFSDCLIERAHLNRFAPVEGDPTRVKFVTDPASKIYNSEAGLNFPKRLVKRDKLKLRYTGNDEVDNWLNDNVAYWVYIFIDHSHEYNVFSINGSKVNISASSLGRIYYALSEDRDKFRNIDFMTGATGCICYPVYRNRKLAPNTNNCIICHTRIYNKEEYVDLIINEFGESEFRRYNSDTSFYYNIKLSIIPPFDDVDGATIDENNNLVTPCFGNSSLSGDQNTYAYLGPNFITVKAYQYCLVRTSDELRAVFFGANQTRSSLSSFDYALSENETLTKEEIITSTEPNPDLNPKLNGQNFKELVITAASGDAFSYDIQKLGESKITFQYTEPITPEITKYYLRVKGGTGLYEDGTDENYLGLVGSTDNSLAYTNDQYANFIANNKNFYLQSNMKILSGVKDSVKSGIQSGASGGPMGMLAGAAQGLMSGVSGAITQAIERDMTIDNMKSAPDELKNANGNVIFNMFATDLGLYAEKYEALEGDLQTANNFMNQFGFTFSAIAQVKDYIHIRRYHNYIKAQLQSINGNLSNSARAELRQRFANGIRFWNGNEISYGKENSELWLESGAASFEEWLESQKANS